MCAHFGPTNGVLGPQHCPILVLSHESELAMSLEFIQSNGISVFMVLRPLSCVFNRNYLGQFWEMTNIQPNVRNESILMVKPIKLFII